ncbi:MAG: type I-G CRISPR-associated protein Cas8g2 [Acidithiobacillus ferrivorans]
MTESQIPVDLLNPGQVFACLGFMEAAEILFNTKCEASFNYESGSTAATFSLYLDRDENLISTVIDFLCEAEVYAVLPNKSSLSTYSWNVPMTSPGGMTFPSPEPPKPAKLPARLQAGEHVVNIEHWAEGAPSGRDNMKFWAGSGGYPGAALARDAIKLIHGLSLEEQVLAKRDPFSIAKPMPSAFRFDWRRDYIPLDTGFSLNKLKSISATGYPIVELMAAIGLQNARPKRINKLSYVYSVSSGRLPSSLIRATLGTPKIGFSTRTFHMHLGWPGKIGQARCIINAQEEFK